MGRLDGKVGVDQRRRARPRRHRGADDGTGGRQGGPGRHPGRAGPCAVEAEIRAAGGAATYVHLNVTSESDWQSAVQTAESTYGGLHVLVNNAGILIRATIEETTEDDFDRIMAVNVKGVFLGTKHAIPAMRRAGGGSIVNISSTAGLVGSPGETAAYSATKGGVRLFTKSTAIQHASDNIRCNSVHPGPIATDMIKDMLEDPEPGAADAAPTPQAPRQAGGYRLRRYLSGLG